MQVCRCCCCYCCCARFLPPLPSLCLCLVPLLSRLPPSLPPSLFLTIFLLPLIRSNSRFTHIETWRMQTLARARAHESSRSHNGIPLQSVVASALDGQDRAWIAAQEADKRAFVTAEANSKLRTENVRLKKFIQLRQEKIVKDAARSVFFSLFFLSALHGIRMTKRSPPRSTDPPHA
jgi:hypothetical protein